MNINTKNVCSALGIGLAFIAMLSLIAMPTFAAAEESGYVEHWHNSDHLTWHVRAYAAGAYDNNNQFTSQTWNQDLWNADRTGGSVTFTSTLTSATVEARSYLGNNVAVTSWVRPAGYSPQTGGSVV